MKSAATLQRLISGKQSCVIDNTNTSRAVRSRWINSAKEKNISVIGYFFESELDQALERNSRRVGKAQRAGA